MPHLFRRPTLQFALSFAPAHSPRAAATMPGPSPANLLSVFPEKLAARLFANAKPAKLAADEVLFLAGDPGDGCYRVEQGLLKVSMIAPTGAERILAIVGPGAIVGELSTIDGAAALGIGRGRARFRIDLRQPRARSRPSPTSTPRCIGIW